MARFKHSDEFRLIEEQQNALAFIAKMGGDSGREIRQLISDLRDLKNGRSTNYRHVIPQSFAEARSSVPTYMTEYVRVYTETVKQNEGRFWLFQSNPKTKALAAVAKLDQVQNQPKPEADPKPVVPARDAASSEDRRPASSDAPTTSPAGTGAQANRGAARPAPHKIVIGSSGSDKPDFHAAFTGVEGNEGLADVIAEIIEKDPKARLDALLGRVTSSDATNLQAQPQTHREPLRMLIIKFIRAYLDAKKTGSDVEAKAAGLSAVAADPSSGYVKPKPQSQPKIVKKTKVGADGADGKEELDVLETVKTLADFIDTTIAQKDRAFGKGQYGLGAVTDAVFDEIEPELKKLGVKPHDKTFSLLFNMMVAYLRGQATTEESAEAKRAAGLAAVEKFDTAYHDANGDEGQKIKTALDAVTAFLNPNAQQEPLGRTLEEPAAPFADAKVEATTPTFHFIETFGNGREHFVSVAQAGDKAIISYVGNSSAHDAGKLFVIDSRMDDAALSAVLGEKGWKRHAVNDLGWGDVHAEAVRIVGSEEKRRGTVGYVIPPTYIRRPAFEGLEAK